MAQLQINNELEKPINIILIGDTYVGKSCLVTSYAKDEFPLEYTPTVFEQFTAGPITRQRSTEKGSTFSLNIMDSSGLKDHKAIRQTMYKQADAIVFCFSLADLKVRNNSHRMMQNQKHKKKDEEEKTSSTMSLNNIRTVWLPEVLEVIEKSEDSKQSQPTNPT